ncbi:hypothetical protein D9756_005414 [Leucocoprinus leucothites]|uniref:F-box domain-containing protein n=1 Tax=Leucocoprinus leucothites TaxID=201217 RepID=A0A8H5D7W3_9AGAR|nr:hypothetical protein D9756_005414 [Leucoagaricus leucothites]
MSKRSLSPQDLPPAKRLHIALPKTSQKHVSIVDALYDELILSIFSYLSWFDLCVTQLINRTWARLAVDNELWRIQYLLTFGKPRLRGVRGPTIRPGSREVKPLPVRARVNESVYKDWKWMFRISSNWRKGRCSIEELPCPSRLALSQSRNRDKFSRHLLLTSNLTITASSRPSYGPVIHVTGPTESCSIVCRPDDTILCRITTLVNDQSILTADHSRVLSFLSTGEFMCYRFKHSPLSSTLLFRSSIPGSHLIPVTQAVYHHPLLITLSQDFTLALYSLEFNSVNLTQTLSSFTSFPPVSMVLSTPSPTIYKLVLAYAIPVYPRHWTVGATELMISGTTMTVDSAPGPALQDSSLSFANQSKSQTLTVCSTRSARAVDVPFGWVDERKLRIMREQWGRKVTSVADIQTDGKWIILSPGDQLTGLENRLVSPGSALNPSYPSPMPKLDDPDGSQMNPFTAPSLHSPTSLQLYRLILPPQNSVSSSPPRLSFVRTLHGQTGPVTALSLSDGRCVSSGLNGSIWVWDLEAGTGAEVATASLDSIDGLVLGPDAELIKGSVSFDERRLIITQTDNVVVRRFDV